MNALSLVLCSMVVCALGWQNDYDRDHHFECPTGQTVSRIQSKHSNKKEDRVWQYYCVYKRTLGNCRWFYNINGFDQDLLLQCPNNGAIVATRSYHDNHPEDRRFSFKCCDITNPGTSCRFTDYVNGFDGRMDYFVPANKYLRGVFSRHQNHQEDRIWKFEVCNL